MNNHNKKQKMTDKIKAKLRKVLIDRELAKLGFKKSESDNYFRHSDGTDVCRYGSDEVTFLDIGPRCSLFGTLPIGTFSDLEQTAGNYEGVSVCRGYSANRMFQTSMTSLRESVRRTRNLVEANTSLKKYLERK